MLLSQASLVGFIHENAIKTENNEPLEFKIHRFLWDIYCDRSPFLCCIKAAQIGFTTYEILKSLHEAKNEGIDIIYVLPTADDVKQFSGGKTNRIIDNNPVFQKWTADKDSVEQKRVGGATIYYRGSFTERTALMISAKKLIVDELDRCKPEIVEQYDSRLQHTINPRKAFFSNPTIPDFGIDRYWNKSDKKKWHISHSCGQTYPMEENCIDYAQEKYICPHCKQEITDEERTQGKWIKTSEGEWSGYWIPLWINPMFSAKKICTYKREKTGEYFYNFVAGLPYVNPNDALTEKALSSCLDETPNSQNGRIIIGLDTGHNLHYTLMNKEGVFYHGYCMSPQEANKPDYDPYTEIEKQLLRYPRSVLVSDQGGDLIGIRKLQAKYPGRVFLVWFTKETKNKELVRWGERDEFGKVQADRNRMIQMIVDYINENRVIFNGTKEDWKPFFEHALNIYRVKDILGDENDPQYGWRWVWKRKGPDHWFMSMVYAWIGFDRFQDDLAQIVSKKNIYSDIKTSYEENKLNQINARIIRGEQLDW